MRYVLLVFCFQGKLHKTSFKRCCHIRRTEFNTKMNDSLFNSLTLSIVILFTDKPYNPKYAFLETFSWTIIRGEFRWFNVFECMLNMIFIDDCFYKYRDNLVNSTGCSKNLSTTYDQWFRFRSTSCSLQQLEGCEFRINTGFLIHIRSADFEHFWNQNFYFQSPNR